MKKKIYFSAALTFILALLLISGCGGSRGASKASTSDDAIALLVQSGQAVSGVGSYRVSGKMQMDSDQSQGAEPLALSVDVEGEMQQSGGTLNQHMVMSSGDARQESYTIGPDYYIFVADKGWGHTNSGNSKAENSSIGMIDIQQLGLMAQLGQDIQIFEENSERIGISVHLSEDFFKASLQSGEGVSQESLDAAEQYLSGLAADVRLWLLKDSMLVDNVELQSDLIDIQPYGNIKMSMDLKILDYNQGPQITLPEEAKNAVEITASS